MRATVPRPQRRRGSIARRRGAAGPGLVVGLLLIVGVAACGASDGPERSAVVEPQDPAGTTVTVDPVPPDPVDDEEAVRRAYGEAHAAYFEAAASPEAENRLARTRTGPALVEAQAAIDALAAAGRRAQVVGNKVPKSTVLDVGVDGKAAAVKSCDVDDTVVIDADDGTVVRDEPEARLVESIMVRHSTGWKVRESAVVDRWPGETRCLEDRRADAGPGPGRPFAAGTR